MAQIRQPARQAQIFSTKLTWARLFSRDHLEYFIMMAPALVLFAIFVAYPVLGGIYFSMTDWNGVQMDFKFIGLQNYITFFNDFYVLVPLRNTILYAIVLTVLQNIASLFLAVTLERKLFTKNLLRTLIFIPVLLSPLMVGYLWGYLFSEPITAFGKLVNIPIIARNLLGHPDTSLMAGVLVTVWRMVGWTMVVYIAALQSIPKEMYEAASIDGASGWKRFWNITFPLIAPAFTVNMVITMERGLKEFDTLFALTKGGPGNSSEVISMTIYRESFEYYRAGYGATLGVMLFLIIIVITIIQLIALRKKEEYVSY